MTNSDRVLVIFPGALGDLICLLPALRVLARRYRGCRLELMARAELADFATGRMGIARGHSIDRREVSLLFSPADDAATAASEFFGAFSAIHSFFGFGDPRPREVLVRACRGAVLFHPFRPASGGHISAAYLEAVGEPRNKAGIRDGANDSAPTPREGIELRAAEDLAAARQLLAQYGITEERFILLMPGSGSPAKNWPKENYLELGRKLGESVSVMIVLGPAEEHLTDAFPGLKILRNPDLGTLAGMACLASAFVGNDSGVAHLAAASGGPGVVIFGPTDPARWRPLGPVLVLRRIPLRNLTWQEVADALESLPRRAESSQ
jgi:ADP-heptose:LPS heptosyltransferase